MIRRLFLAGVALAATPAAAQVSYPPAADYAAPIADVAAAAARAQAAADAACRSTPSIPPAEMVGGSMGSAGTDCRPADAAAPRITRAATVPTDSAGSWAGTWGKPLAAAPVSIPIPINATTEPVVCNVATTTMTGATGRCWYARTLPSTIIALGTLVSYDLFGASAAGINVQVVAIPPTQ